MEEYKESMVSEEDDDFDEEVMSESSTRTYPARAYRPKNAVSESSLTCLSEEEREREYLTMSELCVSMRLAAKSFERRFLAAEASVAEAQEEYEVLSMHKNASDMKCTQLEGHCESLYAEKLVLEQDYDSLVSTQQATVVHDAKDAIINIVEEHRALAECSRQRLIAETVKQTALLRDDARDARAAAARWKDAFQSEEKRHVKELALGKKRERQFEAQICSLETALRLSARAKEQLTKRQVAIVAKFAQLQAQLTKGAGTDGEEMMMPRVSFDHADEDEEALDTAYDIGVESSTSSSSLSERLPPTQVSTEENNPEPVVFPETKSDDRTASSSSSSVQEEAKPPAPARRRPSATAASNRRPVARVHAEQGAPYRTPKPTRPRSAGALRRPGSAPVTRRVVEKQAPKKTASSTATAEAAARLKEDIEMKVRKLEKSLRHHGSLKHHALVKALHPSNRQASSSSSSSSEKGSAFDTSTAPSSSSLPSTT